MGNFLVFFSNDVPIRPRDFFEQVAANDPIPASWLIIEPLLIYQVVLLPHTRPDLLQRLLAERSHQAELEILTTAQREAIHDQIGHEAVRIVEMPAVTLQLSKGVDGVSIDRLEPGVAAECKHRCSVVLGSGCCCGGIALSAPLMTLGISIQICGSNAVEGWDLAGQALELDCQGKYPTELEISHAELGDEAGAALC